MFNYYLSNVYIHAKSIAPHRVFGVQRYLIFRTTLSYIYGNLFF
ncbi:hypothetical protein HMPREF0973_00681 [Prevotella veroralis F0319]|uniref:Uncharacterized protein n=1 Tax=Prevotella veroralis F0319 TaxID=649761 RepID=C9MM52_9BACT|nr:hypothetical protein HMPREF0973_00681 [Prevotella veroralis F0319]